MSSSVEQIYPVPSPTVKRIDSDAELRISQAAAFLLYVAGLILLAISPALVIAAWRWAL